MCDMYSEASHIWTLNFSGIFTYPDTFWESIDTSNDSLVQKFSYTDDQLGNIIS